MLLSGKRTPLSMFATFGMTPLFTLTGRGSGVCWVDGLAEYMAALAKRMGQLEE